MSRGVVGGVSSSRGDPAPVINPDLDKIATAGVRGSPARVWLTWPGWKCNTSMHDRATVGPSLAAASL
jgi:hypothetical protein